MEKSYAVTADYFRAIDSSNPNEYVLDRDSGKPFLFMERERGFDGGSHLQIATIGWSHIPQQPLVQKTPIGLKRNRQYWESEPFLYRSDILTAEHNEGRVSMGKIYLDEQLTEGTPDAHSDPISLWARARGSSKFLHDSSISMLKTFQLTGTQTHHDLVVFYMLETFYNYSISYRNRIIDLQLLVRDSNRNVMVHDTVNKFLGSMYRNEIFSSYKVWLLSSVLRNTFGTLQAVVNAPMTSIKVIGDLCKDFILQHMTNSDVTQSRGRLLYWWCILPHVEAAHDNYNFTLFAIAFCVEHKTFPTWSLYEQSKRKGTHMGEDSSLFRTADKSVTANSKFHAFMSALESSLQNKLVRAMLQRTNLLPQLQTFINSYKSGVQLAEGTLTAIDNILSAINNVAPAMLQGYIKIWQDARKSGRVTLAAIEEYFDSHGDAMQSQDDTVNSGDAAGIHGQPEGSDTPPDQVPAEGDCSADKVNDVEKNIAVTAELLAEAETFRQAHTERFSQVYESLPVGEYTFDFSPLSYYQQGKTYILNHRDGLSRVVLFYKLYK